MNRAIRHPLLQWLIYGHLWLGLGMAAQAWWLGLFMERTTASSRYTWALAFGTIAAYGLMRWVRSRDPRLVASAHLTWVRERRMAVLVVCALCCIVAGVLCWPPYGPMLRWLLPAGVLSFLYVSPLTAKDGQAIGLRGVPGMKLLMIAVVCVISTVAIPMSYDAVDHSALSIALMMCMRLPLFMAIAITFDIRDTLFDPPSLRTLPQVIGVRGARWVALLLLVLSAVFEHVFLRGLGHSIAAWTCLIGYAIAFVLVVIAKRENGPVFYGTLLDGILIIVPVSVWLGM
jgi:hypothetical protein